MARIINVPPEALPTSGEADHLRGLVVGIEDVRGAFNARELAVFLAAGGQFDPRVVDSRSRARAIVFQSWLGAGDAQVLVRPTDGAVFSIDHGDCFGNTSTGSDPTVIITDIPGVAAQVGREAQYVNAAVGSIESLSDQEILECVSKIPPQDPWRAPPDRRLEIARWLMHRRDQLQGVMRRWLQP